jgi:glycosyltransferase involved in cell wall biosynthesis
LIIVYHSTVKVDEVVSDGVQQISFDPKDSIATVLGKLAQEFSSESIVWCNSIFKQDLQIASITNEFHHAKMMLSYNPSDIDFLGDDAGYVEEFLYLNINRNISYPTWRMSSAVGVIHASVLLELENKIVKDANFDYYLNSVAKLCMPLGLLCYSEPKLLNKLRVETEKKTDLYTLFRFTRQHYKVVWVFLLLLNMLLYERKLPVIPFLYAFFFRRRKATEINLESILVSSSKKVVSLGTIDVLIPTIGRKKYLYDFLVDLTKQTVLPTSVIIVEQNPQLGSVSELTFLKDQSWPFEIKHTFIHQTGACNARNIALSQISSEWVFFADDDIRIDSTLIEDTFRQISAYGIQAVSIQSHHPNAKPINSVVSQWHTFGGGSSFVASESLKGCSFPLAYEFGFGEDFDFGVQLRSKGYDVLYFPNPLILHLKAPIGGFRTKHVFKWQDAAIQPKPSPTVMLFFIKNYSRQQLGCYKTTLFFKYFKYQKIRNPLTYYKNFRKQWKQSLYWANELKKVV